MQIRRFIKELSRPCIKCERVGHNMKERYRSGYYPGGGFRAVVTNVTQAKNVCRRCGHEENWETIDKVGVQSFSAPTETMRKIRNSDSNNPHWVDFW